MNLISEETLTELMEKHADAIKALNNMPKADRKALEDLVDDLLYELEKTNKKATNSDIPNGYFNLDDINNKF